MKTKLFVLLTILIAIVSFSITEAGSYNYDTPIDILVNDNYIKMDAEPFLYNNTTYVPVRFVSEALGANEVSWDGNSSTAIIKHGNTTIGLTAGKYYSYVNGSTVNIANGIKLINSRIFVPIRFLADELGATVNWDSTYFNVQIYKDNITVPSDLIDNAYTYDDVYWLSRIIQAESESEPMEGKIGVGNVILNRVNSNEYPNTIYGVIFDSEFGVQFEPIINGTIYNTPSSESIIAAKRALAGENTVGSSLYFLNPRIAENSWIPNNRTKSISIGNHDFYL